MQFLVDSGATNNFISFSEFIKLGEIMHKCTDNRSVKLADGKLVTISGFCLLLVDVASVLVLLQFSVLPCSIPTILGMPFLLQCNPKIDWKKRVMTMPHGSRSVSV